MGRGMEGRRSEEEAMAGEVERNEIRVEEEERERDKGGGVYGTLEFHLYGLWREGLTSQEMFIYKLLRVLGIFIFIFNFFVGYFHLIMSSLFPLKKN